MQQNMIAEKILKMVPSSGTDFTIENNDNAQQYNNQAMLEITSNVKPQTSKYRNDHTR